MKLRTLEGKRVRAELTTEYPVSADGSSVLVVNGEPYAPEEADFFLESATPRELKRLVNAGYDLPRWSGPEEEEEFTDEDYLEDEDLEDESEDD